MTKNILVGNKKCNIFFLKTLERTLRLHEKPTEIYRYSYIISKFSSFWDNFGLPGPGSHPIKSKEIRKHNAGLLKCYHTWITDKKKVFEGILHVNVESIPIPHATKS
jgi:hypothetical protein